MTKYIQPIPEEDLVEANDFYDLLDLPPNEVPDRYPQETVQDAYKRAASEYHPDQAPPEERDRARQRYKHIQAAADLLEDPERKEIYDIVGHDKYMALIPSETQKKNDEETAKFVEMVREKIPDPANIAGRKRAVHQMGPDAEEHHEDTRIQPIQAEIDIADVDVSIGSDGQSVRLEQDGETKKVIDDIGVEASSTTSGGQTTKHRGSQRTIEPGADTAESTAEETEESESYPFNQSFNEEVHKDEEVDTSEFRTFGGVEDSETEANEQTNSSTPTPNAGKDSNSTPSDQGISSKLKTPVDRLKRVITSLLGTEVPSQKSGLIVRETPEGRWPVLRDPEELREDESSSEEEEDQVSSWLEARGEIMSLYGLHQSRWRSKAILTILGLIAGIGAGMYGIWSLNPTTVSELPGLVFLFVLGLLVTVASTSRFAYYHDLPGVFVDESKSDYRRPLRRGWTLVIITAGLIYTAKDPAVAWEAFFIATTEQTFEASNLWISSVPQFSDSYASQINFALSALLVVGSLIAIVELSRGISYRSWYDRWAEGSAKRKEPILWDLLTVIPVVLICWVFLASFAGAPRVQVPGYGSVLLVIPVLGIVTSLSITYRIRAYFL